MIPSVVMLNVVAVTVLAPMRGLERKMKKIVFEKMKNYKNNF
jgi:hypothetical protein